MKLATARSYLAALVLGTLMTDSVEAKPLSFKCSFPSLKLEMTFVLESSKLPKPENGSFALGSAVLVGNAGTSELITVRGDNAISFIEPLATGATQSTTIDLQTGEAVHSRHSLLSWGDARKFVNSQAKGNCLLLD